MDRGRKFETFQYQRRKKRQVRMFIKLIAILGGIAVLIVCLLSGLRIVTELDRKAEAIGQQEAAVLLRALYEEVLPSQKDWPDHYEKLLEEFAGNGDDPLTYASYQEVLGFFPEESRPQEVGHGNQTVGREAFYTDYFTIVDHYGLGDIILRRELVLLADDTDVVLSQKAAGPEAAVKPEDSPAASGETLNNPIAVAEDASYLDKSGRAGDYLFRPFTAVVKVKEPLPQLLAVEKEPSGEDLAYTIHNIWLMETLEDGLRCFWNNAEFTVRLPEEVWEKNDVKREQVADISFVDGVAAQVICKQDKISGKILSIGDTMIEVEGAGTLFYADHLKIYKLYGALERYYTSDLRVGYAFTDFVLEDGKIAACLVTKDEAMENIRVLIQSGNYQGKFHDKVELTCDTGYEVIYGDNSEARKAGEHFEITPDSEYFEGQGRVLIKPDALTGRISLESVQRSQGTPEYRGVLEIVKNSDGMFIVNEVLLEEYLYAVVPSEMPASYPMEALKVQAVCARTYAYKKMEQAGLAKFGAHVDDSTTYQVYNNILENAQTTKAVKETEGVLLKVYGETADTFYYSTSCGFGTDADIWKGGNGSALSYLVPRHIAPQDENGVGSDAGSQESEDGQMQEPDAETADARQEADEAQQMRDEAVFTAYIESVNEQDYEHSQPWYRWSYTVEKMDADGLKERLKIRYDSNKNLILTEENGEFVSKDIGDIGEIRDIRVVKRGPGGIIDELLIQGSKADIKVITEHNVRYVLCDRTQDHVVRQDGSEAFVSTLLPSSFFTIYPSKEGDSVIGYKLAGGGFGHGVGMSQNGAREMAGAGLDAESILTFFYDGAVLTNIYEE